eukprot:gene10019-7906_t
MINAPVLHLLRSVSSASLGRLAPAVGSLFSTQTSTGFPVKVHNEGGSKRVVVTKELPGDRWLQILVQAGCRVEVSQHPDTILSNSLVKQLIGPKCDGVIGQLTEDWSSELFEALKQAGGKAYSNYAVGYNNVKVEEATKRGIPVGNTPGVLTETTAELAAALTLSAARRVPEADVFMRAGKYEGWLPTLFVGNLLQNKTVGIIGAGRIGAAYARMMVEGHKMNLVYFDPYPNKKLEEYLAEYGELCAYSYPNKKLEEYLANYPNKKLEEYLAKYGELLRSNGERPIAVQRVETVEEVLRVSDVVSLHCNLDKNTHHLMNTERLNMMKPDAVLINASRGQVIDETALVAHLKANPNFRCGLDVFEDEPAMKPGLADQPNAVIVPHIASASLWTRSGMATLAAANVAGVLQGYPVWGNPNDVLPFIEKPVTSIPKSAPSIVNSKELNLQISKD